VVAIDFGRCLRNKLEVRSGQVAKWPASMAFIQVDGTGLQQAWWRYLTMSFWLRCSCTLLAACWLVVFVGAIVVSFLRLRTHRPLASRVPVSTIASSFWMVTWCWVKRASLPLSQNWPIDMSALLVRSGKIWACRAARGSWGISRRAVWVDQMVVSLGKRTGMP
jgi:hypothetical protein